VKALAILACAACYGQSDAPLARGMNWGIFSLLVTTVLVLGGVAASFVWLARRSAAAAAPLAPSTLDPRPSPLDRPPSPLVSPS
jgi:heme/copper-type cytochrome/quinol oxidase subunit 2